MTERAFGGDKYRDFRLTEICNEENAARVEKALDNSEVLFYELDTERGILHLCNCDNCERAARSALKEVGFEIELIKKEYL